MVHTAIGSASASHWSQKQYCKTIITCSLNHVDDYNSDYMIPYTSIAQFLSMINGQT